MYKYLSLLIVFVFISCKQNQEKPQEKELTTFTDIQFPEMENSSLPYLFSDGKDLLLSFVSENDSMATLYYSKLKGDRWSTPEAITSGTDWFVNWADYPQIAKNQENYIAHILQKSDEATYAYDVMITQKQEGSAWSTPFKIHSDTTKTEHGFVSYAPFCESQFMVSWLDGRNTSGGHHEHDGGAMTLRAAIVNNDGTLQNEFLLDESVCDCCQTSSAMTKNGHVVVYRDRSENEVRDISIVRFDGEKWTEPVSVFLDNWEIPGCPVNGPRVAAFENTIAVAWFTAADGVSKVQVAFSTNNGEEFTNPIRTDLGNPLGRVDVVMIDHSNALVSWVEDIDGHSYIKLRKITAAGHSGEGISVMSTDESRASGFPQIEIFNGKVYVAHTDLNGKITQVKTSVYALEDL